MGPSDIIKSAAKPPFANYDIVVYFGCGSATGSDYADPLAEYDASYSGSGDEADEERDEFDEDAAREAAEDDVRGESYDGLCTLDCSGHEAGFEYAADGHEDEGTSNSRSFDEGQEAFSDRVDERVEERREDYEAGDDEADDS